MCWRNDWWHGREWKRDDEKGKSRNGDYWKGQMGEKQGYCFEESEKKDEERMDEKKRIKIKKFGKTRKDTRWKRSEFVIVENVKKSESEERGKKELKEFRGC